MKKIIFLFAFVLFASLSFAQQQKDFSDFMIINDANLKKPLKVKSGKKRIKFDFKTPYTTQLKSEYQLADGSTLKWTAYYDPSSKTVSMFGFDHSSNGLTAQEKSLPVDFWAKAQQSLTKSDETNQKLSIEALLKQAYK